MVAWVIVFCYTCVYTVCHLSKAMIYNMYNKTCEDEKLCTYYTSVCVYSGVYIVICMYIPL